MKQVLRFKMTHKIPIIFEVFNKTDFTNINVPVILNIDPPGPYIVLHVFPYGRGMMGRLNVHKFVTIFL